MWCDMRITMSRFLWRIIDDGTEYQRIIRADHD